MDARGRPVTVALAGAGALAVAMGIGRFAFTPILPLMQQDAGLSIAAGGWLASANYLGYLLGATAAMVIRIPAAIAIRGGLVAIGLLTAGMGLEQRLVGWLVLRALAGFASAWVLISVSAWCLERLAPYGRPVLGGAVFAGVGGGIAVAGGSCLALMHVGAGSALAWLSLGALSLGVTGLAWRRLGAGDAPATGGGALSARGGLRWDAESVRLVCCYGVSGFGYIIPATFLPVMARQTVADPWVFGWAWPLFGATAAAATLAAAVARRVADNRRLWVLGHLVMALGVALPVVVPGIGGIMLAAACVGGTFMVNTMAGLEEAREVAGGHAPGLMAAMTASFALGQVAGPVLVSSLAGAGGDVSAGLLVAGVLLSASAWALHRGRTRMATSTRMPPLDPDVMTDAQRQAAAALAAGPRGGVRGPFVPLLRSPELLDRRQRVGEYLRYHSALPSRLSELVILVVAREWTQQFEWLVHVPLAGEAGLDREVVTALAEGRRPSRMAADEEVAYDFCDELLRRHGVSDPTYRRAVASFGEQGVIDILGIAGYFTTVSMVLNVAHTPPPDAAAVAPLRAFPL
jgi:alkylhydroperoxidase family enzyme